MLLRGVSARRRWSVMVGVAGLATALFTLSGGSTAHATGGAITNYTGTGISNPYGITAGADGALWFTNQANNSIGRITIGSTPTVTNYTGTGISDPIGITAGPDGALWFTNLGRNHYSIGRITTSGAVTIYTDPSISGPVDITAGPDGAMWFTNVGTNSIGRITTSGTVTNYTDPSINEPQGITAGPDGALWFTNFGNNTIGRITTIGTVTNYTDASINEPFWITAGPDGALWFTNQGNNSIGRITTSGTVTNYTDPSISEPYGISAGPDGALWFTNLTNNSIGRITTSGTVTNYTDASISYPSGITAGPDGALWFANNDNSSIGRITPVGATVSDVAFMGSPTSPQVVITGSGFGTAPPYPSYSPACGTSGLDYGYYLYLNDSTANWDGGLRNVEGGTDCVALVVSAWSNTQIVFGFGSGYNTNGWVLNPDDSYTLTAFGTVMTGTVAYLPAPSVSLSPSSGTPGTALIVSGQSFRPGENVPVTYTTGLTKPKTETICYGIVAGDGSFTCYGHIPAKAKAGKIGKHTVTAKGVMSGLTATTTFKLT